MKCTTVIDTERDEEILIFAHERTTLIEELEELAARGTTELIGYDGESIVKLNAADVYCITVQNDRVLAHTATETFRLRTRLYALEEALGNGFVKIHQSCIVNVKHIERFDTSIGGALRIQLKNGYRDYVSRRRLKSVKERIGFRR